MRELIQMVVVLTLLSVVSGGLLAAIKTGTEGQIETQKIKFDKAPAIKDIFSKATNDPLNERFSLMDDETKRLFFPAEIAGNKNFIAIEGTGTGFGGAIGLMVGIDLEQDKILAARVTSHSETPGIGSKAKDDLALVRRFQGLPVKETYQVKNEGGAIDAIGGATVTSAGVCGAMSDAGRIYLRMKPQIIESMKASN